MNLILFQILFIVLWGVYASFDGIEEAVLYDGLVNSNRKIPQLHPYFFGKRMILLLSIFLLTHNILYICGLISIFSFIHDGFYYVTRHKLDSNVYPLAWTDESKTSTAFFEFNFTKRLIFFILGVILLISSFLI